MGKIIQEESRTLQEFYPDPKLRHMVHYKFAHIFLPQSIHSNPHSFFSTIFKQYEQESALDPTLIIQGGWRLFEAMNGLLGIDSDSVFRRVSDLTMSIQVVAGKPVAVVQMPPPEQSLEVFLIAIVLLNSSTNPENWPQDLQARVFTLEAPHPDYHGDRIGMVCEWTNDFKHRNFGFGVLAEIKIFLEVLAQLILAPDYRADVTYAPHDKNKFKYFT
jgi:hypothetical protein